MGSAHLAAGVAVGAWLAVAVSPTPGTGLIGVLVSAGAAMVPDLDHPRGRAVRRLGPLGWILCRLIRLLSHLAVGRKHRGLSHSLLFALVIGCLTAIIAASWMPLPHAAYLGAAAAAGMVSALAGDLVTVAGLPHLLWPSQRVVSVPRRWRIRTGGVVERWLVLPGLTVAGVLGMAVFTGVAPGLIEGWTGV